MQDGEDMEIDRLYYLALLLAVKILEDCSWEGWVLFDASQ